MFNQQQERLKYLESRARKLTAEEAIEMFRLLDLNDPLYNCEEDYRDESGVVRQEFGHEIENEVGYDVGDSAAIEILDRRADEIDVETITLDNEDWNFNAGKKAESCY